MRHTLAYHTCCSYLLITNASHNNSNTNCDAATVEALEMGVLYFETGGMKHSAPAAVELEAHFTVLLHTSQTSHCRWLDRLGSEMGPMSVLLMFNKESGQVESRFEQSKGIIVRHCSLTCFPQPYLTKGSYNRYTCRIHGCFCTNALSIMG